jgi:hypothetical protein
MQGETMSKAVITVVLTLGALALAPASFAAPAPPLLDAHGCYSTVHLFADDPGRLQPRYVPRRYTLLGWLPGKPYIALWSFACDALSVRGGAAAPTQLSIAAVAIQHPDRQPAEQQPLELPNLWSHYVDAFDTDNPTLARALRRQGFPAYHVRAMRFEDRVVAGGLPAPLMPLTEARVDVPGAWRSWTRPVIQQEPPHSHSNEFWFDTPAGPSVLNVRIPQARDHFCELAAGEQCGIVDAEAGSATAGFLGATHRAADAAIDHAKIERILAFASLR